MSSIMYLNMCHRHKSQVWEPSHGLTAMGIHESLMVMDADVMKWVVMMDWPVDSLMIHIFTYQNPPWTVNRTWYKSNSLSSRSRPLTSPSKSCSTETVGFQMSTPGFSLIASPPSRPFGTWDALAIVQDQTKITRLITTTMPRTRRQNVSSPRQTSAQPKRLQ